MTETDHAEIKEIRSLFTFTHRMVFAGAAAHKQISLLPVKTIGSIVLFAV